jgi:hypothetical protein
MTGTTVPSNGSWVVFLVIGCVALVAGAVLLVVAGRRGREIIDVDGKRGGAGLAATGGVVTLVAFALFALTALVGADNATRSAAARRAAQTLPRSGTAGATSATVIPSVPPKQFPSSVSDLGLHAMTQSTYVNDAHQAAQQMQSQSGSTMSDVVGTVYSKDGNSPYALVVAGKFTESLNASTFVSGVFTGANISSHQSIPTEGASLACGQGDESGTKQTLCAWSNGNAFMIVDFYGTVSITEGGKDTTSLQRETFTS